MDELFELLQIPNTEPISKVIHILTQGKDKTRIFDLAEKQLDPSKHDIFNPILRRDKWQEKPNQDGVKDEDGNVEMSKQLVKVNRIGIAYQKLIVNKTKAFLFGNTPKLKSNPVTEEEKIVLKAVERVLHDIKESSFNRKVAGAISSYTEGGEIWWFQKKDEKHSNYGFPTDIVLKAKVLSPKENELFYSYTDSLGDLLVFTRSYCMQIDGKDTQYYDVYTSKKNYRFQQIGSEITIDPKYPIENKLEKIPAVFGEQDIVEWADVQWSIDRLEVLLSNHAEVNDRNAYPILAIKGEVKSFIEKGPGGAVELENGADMAYVSWDNATASVKLEIENLIKYIHMITQTPNISFEEVKSMGALSGTALKMLFLDAHLKVMEKREIYDEYLQRRINIIKKAIGVLNPKLKTAADNLIIEPEIIPFMVENEKEQVEIALLKNGGKALESHEKSVKNWQGQDTEDYEKIKAEEKEFNSLEYFNPTNVE